MKRNPPPLLVTLLLCSLCIAPLSLHPAQAGRALRYVAPGGNCGGASPCYAQIQDAVAASADGDEIRVAAGTYSQTGTGHGITAVVRIIDRKITLRGGYSTSDWDNSNPAANPTVIDPNQAGIGIYINYQADTGIGDIIIDGLSITDGYASSAGAGADSGGGILIDHTTHVQVTVQYCLIYQNTAEDGSGGGLWATRTDNLQLLDNQIYDNNGSGAVVTNGSSPTIVGNLVRDNLGDGISVVSAESTHTDIRDNQLTGNQGSGINLNTCTGGSLTGNLVSDNHTTGGGGGLDLSGLVNDFTISGNTITGNSALQGGGIDISGSIAEIKNNLVMSNTAGGNGGGGLYLDAGATGANLLVSGNQVYSNTTSNMGGGLLILGHVDVTGNTIRGNSAYSGGGMVATAQGTIANNLITCNSAQIGGGIRTVNAMGLVIERNRVIGNHATNGAGGGMNLWGGFFMDLSLDGNQVLSNTASTQGGGIYLECPTGVDPVPLANTVLANNTAPTGSGLYSTVCDAQLAYNTVASNRGAGADGVGLYLRHPTPTGVYTLENTLVVSQVVGVYVYNGVATLEATFWGAGDWANDADTGTGGSGTIIPGAEYQGDPAFVAPGTGDYHIDQASPVIDQGVDTWIAVDLDGHHRPSGESDIGADEYVDLLYVYLPLITR